MRSISAIRSSTEVCEKLAKARLAAATARSTSATPPPEVTVAQGSSDVGSIRVRVPSPVGRDPLAVDVELSEVLHFLPPYGRATSNVHDKCQTINRHAGCQSPRPRIGTSTASGLIRRAAKSKYSTGPIPMHRSRPRDIAVA